MKTRLVKNISSQFVSYILQFLASVILSVLIGRLLGPEGLGRFSFVTTLAVMFAFSYDWGLNLIIIKEVARNKNYLSKYINNIMGLGLLFSSLSIIAITIILHFFRYEPQLKTQIYLAVAWGILGVISSFFRGAFHAFEKMELETITLIVEKVFLILVAPLILLFWKDLTLLLYAMVTSRVINLCVSFLIYQKKFDKLKIEFSWKFWKVLTKETFPFGLNILFSNIYICSDVVLLGIIRGELDTGLYRAATAVILPLSMITVSVNNSLFPVFSRNHATSKDSLAIGITKASKYLFMLGILLMVMISVFARQIIVIFFTSEFTPSIGALKILSLLVPIRFINYTLGIAATASNLQKHRTWSVGIGALANVLMNLFFIPRLGYIGASITTIITDSIIFFMLLYVIYKYVYAIPILQIIYKPIICAFIIWIFIMVSGRFLSFPILGISALLIYLGTMYLWEGYKKKELLDFVKLMSRSE